VTWEWRRNTAKSDRKNFRSSEAVVMTIRHGGAILLAAFCGIAAINSTAPVGTMPARKPEMVRVVVATADIPRGKTICQEDVKATEWPRQLAPQSAVPNPEDVVGRVTATSATAWPGNSVAP
jgi:Flp pilus assembly protein CpaB